MKITNCIKPRINFSALPYYSLYRETPVNKAEILAREAEYAMMQPKDAPILDIQKEDSDDILLQEDEANETDETQKLAITEHALGEMLIKVQTQRLNETQGTQADYPEINIETSERKLDIKG